MSIMASCHCGAVTLSLELSDGINTARRCDCTMCRMRGAVAVSAPLDGLTVLTGSENLTLYQFNTRTAEHYFCKTCGIYTHHRRRSNPNEYGVNVACIEGMSPFDLRRVEVLDGQNHTSDGGFTDGVAGILTYEAKS